MTQDRIVETLAFGRCPRCGSPLLWDGGHVWCSFIGGYDEKACAYGIDKPVEFSLSRIVELERERDERDGEIARLTANIKRMEYEQDTSRKLLAACSDALLPCPICKGVEGCDHVLLERARAMQAEGVRK